jgi:hypothetical protein
MAEITVAITKLNRYLNLDMRPGALMFVPSSSFRRNNSIKPINPTPPEWRLTVFRRASSFKPPDITASINRPRCIVINDKQLNTQATSGSRSVDFTGRQGYGKIQNTVVVDGYPTNTPVAAEVLVIRLRDRKVVGHACTNATTGQYVIKGLNPGERYATVAFHYQDAFTPAVDTNIFPTVGD